MYMYMYIYVYIYLYLGLTRVRFICNVFTAVCCTDKARASQPSASPSTDGARLFRARCLLSLGLSPALSLTQFGAATHPGMGGGTHRRRAIFERC